MSNEQNESIDINIGNIDGYTVMYTEDYNTICSKCCLSKACPQEGYCMCDDYRTSNELNLEGDIYFIKE